MFFLISGEEDLEKKFNAPAARPEVAVDREDTNVEEETAS
jgi:hypothetical protein